MPAGGRASTTTATSAATGASPPTTVAPTPVPPALSPTTQAALDDVWRSTPSTGCLVVIDRGSIVYERDPDRSVVAASVTKILTAIAAVDVLGADTRFSTGVRAAGTPVDGTIEGDLWLVGGGDPVLGTNAWAAQLDSSPPLYTSLDELADRVVGAGVRSVTGAVVGDDSRYDDVRYVPTMPRRFIADGEIGPLSALSVNDGFAVWGHPGEAFADPPGGAARVFSELLRARGVSIGGEPTTGRAPDVPDLVTVASPTVAELTNAMLRDSDNGTAELLVKAIGYQRTREGSTTAGLRVLEEALAARSLPTAGSQIRDGSGLTESQAVTCRLLAAAASQSTPALDGLPVAGRSGALRERFQDTAAEGRLRAKTGSLDGVAALAGVVETSNGRRLAFAYVLNGLAPGASARSRQDALGVVLAEDDAR